MPVELTAESQSDNAVLEGRRATAFKLEKYVWNPDDSQEFMSCLLSDEVKGCFLEATEFVDNDINISLF